MPISTISRFASTPQETSAVSGPPLLSVIVPFFNEQEVLETFHQRLHSVLSQQGYHSEIVYVDDGSQDGSLDKVQQLATDNVTVRCVVLSRNFGKEAAMSAGLAHVCGEAVVLIDADLQDPPELIPQMVSAWQSGFDVVNMQRKTRHGETWFKRFSAASYYKILNGLSDRPIPENVGDFRLLSAEVVQHIVALPERNRYMKGLFTWPGFRQTTLQFERDARFCGETKWNYFKLLGLAVDGISAFSIRPLRFATVMGSLIALSALGYGALVVVKTLLFGEPVDGYPSLMVTMLGLGGIQLLSIGVLGEYIGRIFVETKQRPIYLVQEVWDLNSASQIATCEPPRMSDKPAVQPPPPAAHQYQPKFTVTLEDGLTLEESA